MTLMVPLPVGCVVSMGRLPAIIRVAIAQLFAAVTADLDVRLDLPEEVVGVSRQRLLVEIAHANPFIGLMPIFSITFA